MQDLLLSVLSEDQPLRLAVNSASLPPLLAGTTSHSFPPQAPLGQSLPASATPGGPAMSARGIQALNSGGVFPGGQVSSAKSRCSQRKTHVHCT